MSILLTFLAEYWRELIIIFISSAMMIIVTITRKRLSGKPKSYIIGILLIYFLVIASGIMHIIIDMSAIQP